MEDQNLKCANAAVGIIHVPKGKVTAMVTRNVREIWFVGEIIADQSFFGRVRIVARLEVCKH